MAEHQSGADDVVAERLMADPELDGPVGVPLAVLEEHLERFNAIDPTTFHAALDRFAEGRPFITTEDALRAVLRSFGVRAKLIPAHLGIVEWHEQGWQLMEIHRTELNRSGRI